MIEVCVIQATEMLTSVHTWDIYGGISVSGNKLAQCLCL